MGQVVAFDTAQSTSQPAAIDALLAQRDARARVDWTLKRFGHQTVMTSSFGAQSAVMLHMVTQQQPDLPVVLVDTGYLFPETYRFVDELTERLGLNLHVYRPRLSAAWQEARFGRLWEQGSEGIERYNRMNKVEPMQRALGELGAEAWLSGIRRDQSTTRVERGYAEDQNGRIKIHPILDWNDRDVYQYLKAFDLPYHPLWHQGYISIGDWHTSRRPADGVSEEDARFFGLKRECGLHTEV